MSAKRKRDASFPGTGHSLLDSLDEQVWGTPEIPSKNKGKGKSLPSPSTSKPVAGSSQNPYVLDEDVPKPKRKRSKKDPDAPLPEKRAAKFKSKCPQNILDRVDRVMSQRFFMIDRKREGKELKEEFSVLGSTGNVYKVTVGPKPDCNCPDSMKGNHCKHILFIYLKVLQVPTSSTHWYQKALLSSELEEVFRNAPQAPNSVLNPRVQEAFAKATGKEPSTPSASQSQKKMPSEDDDCPICYDTMGGAKESDLVFCEVGCGNALHKVCFTQWKTTAATQGKPLTCVWCRARWPSSTPASGNNKDNRARGGYLNLASVAGVSPQRDTSSYYHGPRRGYRSYGYDYDPYQDFDED